MNITHPNMWHSGPVPRLCYSSIAELMGKRGQTFQGFAKIEEGKGVLVPSIPMHTAKGQDLIRLLCFRVLEEATESFMAKEPPHIKEEAIDAINYLFSLVLLDPVTAGLDEFVSDLTQAAHTFFNATPRYPRGISVTGLACVTVSLAGHLSEGLRNRSWMQQAQDIFYAQAGEMRKHLCDAFMELLVPFEDWDDFYRYFVSKDNVLQFRLKTRY